MITSKKKNFFLHTIQTIGSKTKQDQFREKTKPGESGHFKSKISQNMQTITNIFDSK